MSAPPPAEDIARLTASVGAQRAEFLDLVGAIRPRLHRYCSRMCGSVLDGEDLVQETLSRAFFRLPTLRDDARIEQWLFRIAHNCAIDLLRRRRTAPERGDDHYEAGTAAGDDDAGRGKRVEEALTAMVTHLPPKERACVVLKEVLDHPLADIAEIVDSTVGGVKAALHRGRRKLADLDDEEAPVVPLDAQERGLVDAYIAHFNRRDWDGVRDLIRADARLEVVGRGESQGREAITSTYFFNYTRLAWRWKLEWARVDGTPQVIHWRDDGDGWRPHAVVCFTWVDGAIAVIRDYVHTDYLLTDARIDPLSG